MKSINSKFRLAATGIGVAALIAAFPASADVARYQTTVFSFSTDVGPGLDQHDYVLEHNPCDGSFQGTGTEAAMGYDEALTCTLDSGVLNCTGVYHATATSGTALDGYTFTYAVPFTPFPGIGISAEGTTTADSVVYPTVFTSNGALSSSWRNHGAYVAAHPAKSDAARACIGMPVKNKG